MKIKEQCVENILTRKLKSCVEKYVNIKTEEKRVKNRFTVILKTWV